MSWLIVSFLVCISSLSTTPMECVDILNQVVEEVDEKNPYWYTIWVAGYPYDSLANEIVNYWYDQSNWDIDMILTFIAENGWFDATKVSKTNDYWLCQLHYNRTNAKRINDERWSDPIYQAEVCVDKWLAVPNPSKVWYGWKVKEKYRQQIYYFE